MDDIAQAPSWAKRTNASFVSGEHCTGMHTSFEMAIVTDTTHNPTGPI